MRFLLLVIMFHAFDGIADDKGLKIATRAAQQEDGFKDQKVKLEMTLTDKNGKSSQRNIVMQTLEVKGDGDKTLMHFLSPATVKGTKFLTFSHKNKSDEQWIFLPRLKRVKRIASGNRAGSFMASEFSYEDLTSQEVERYNFDHVQTKKCGEHTCDVIDRMAKEKGSGYSRARIQIVQGKNQTRPHAIDFYDRKGELFKSLKYEGYKQYKGKFWRAHKMTMQNHVNGKSTVLSWSDFEFGKGVKKSDFNKSKLK